MDWENGLDGTDAGTLETAKDAGPGPSGVVKRWMLELELADKEEEKWRKAGDDVIARYRDEKKRSGASFNILYSNTATLEPALYAQVPTPDIRRRFPAEEQPLGKAASEVLERAISFSIDQYDFDAEMEAAVQDLLLPGRAVTRVRYEPSFRTVPAPGRAAGADDGSYPPADDEAITAAGGDDANNAGTAAHEEIASEAVYCETVSWKDFRRGPGRTWSEVQWISFAHYPTREECVEWFGAETGGKVDLVYTPDGMDEEDGGPDTDTFKRGIVFEIWDKSARKVVWISESVDEGPLRTDDDPLSLQGFYPIPRPLYAVRSPGTLVPIELYRLYADQAEELDRVTMRISALIEVCKARGIADSTISELWNLELAEDGQFAALENASDHAAAMGSLSNAVWMWPLETFIQVIRELYVNRDQIKGTIYEITGISDILRGDTKASETATAQSIKAQWGSLRLRRMQKDTQRYARDLIRIMAEIIAEKFQPETLQMMTDVKLPSQQQKMMAQQAAQQAQMQQQPMPQGVENVLKLPSWEEVIQLLRSDELRSYRVDIETDSTIQPDEQSDKEAVTQLLGGITQYLASMGPAVQAGYIPAEAAKTILMAAVRRFRLGREVEAALDEVGQQDPNAQAQQAQQAQMQAQQAQQAQQAEQQAQQQKMQMEMQKVQAQSKASVQKAQADMAATQQDAEFAKQEHAMKMAELEMSQQIAVQKFQMEMAKMAAEGDDDGEV